MLVNVTAQSFLSDEFQVQARAELGDAMSKLYDAQLMRVLSEGPIFYEVCEITNRPEYSHLSYEIAKQFLPLFKQGYTYDQAIVNFPEYFV